MSENNSSRKLTIFATGGAGYVGSHTVAVLLEHGHHVIVGDNFSNVDKGIEDKPQNIRTLEKVSGRQIQFYEIDLRSRESLIKVFEENSIDCVIHFAALKAVGESVCLPLNYYKNNVAGTINLLEVMKEYDVKKLVFSSSATVYGQPQYLPLDEKHPVGKSCTSPYGKSKYFIEEMLQDIAKAEPDFKFVILRYFNPVGAHKSGLLGENPSGIPNNLVPYISKVASGRLSRLYVFGNNYNTRDGTGIRDYIHVVDLAMGHVSALHKLFDDAFIGCKIYNLGLGEGYTVLEVISAFEKACGKKIPYEIVAQRPGDVAILLSNVDLAEKELGWKATSTIDEMCEDTWRWVRHYEESVNK